jgi:hypothetical protein
MSIFAALIRTTAKVVGVWLAIAPWGLGFGSLAVAAWNRVIVGLLVPAFAAWRLWDVSQKATA